MPTKLASDRYIYPPRPHSCIPRDQLPFFAGRNWIGQLKYNDSRALIKYLPDGKIELWNRHAEKFRSYHAPDWLLNELRDLQPALGLKESDWSLLDGGLLNSKHESIRDTIVIWDILVKNGEYLVGTTYADRYAILIAAAHANGMAKSWHYEPPHKKHEPINFGLKLSEHVLMPRCLQPDEWDSAWLTVEKVNAPYLAVEKGPVLEGLVLKDPKGELKRAWKEENNGEWMTRCRVTTGRHAF